MKFRLGRLVATRGVVNLMATNAEFANFVSDSLKRYVACDWGDLDESDLTQNEAALQSGDDRLFAAYKFPSAFAGCPTDNKIGIITEWDHSVTTVLFPSEYRGGITDAGN